MKRIVLAILAVLMLATPVLADDTELGARIRARICSDLNDIGYQGDYLTTEEIQEIISVAIIYAQQGSFHSNLMDAVTSILDRRLHTSTYKAVVLGYALGVSAVFRIVSDEQRLEAEKYGNK